jgi:hypothetical protein
VAVVEAVKMVHLVLVLAVLAVGVQGVQTHTPREVLEQLIPAVVEVAVAGTVVLMERGGLEL